MQRPNLAAVYRLPGFIPCYDQCIWGQPNNLLNLHPTIVHSKSSSLTSNAARKMTIEQKFGPYWDSSVQDNWVEFLGDFLDVDPSTSSAKKPTWLYTMLFFNHLSIPLFGKGLTLLQTVNNLVFANIVAMPTEIDVAIWIYHNQSLGAYAGLQLLGFSNMNLATSVIYAFKAVYDHLNAFLTPDDKEILGFNPIFLEHTLCKVACWTTCLRVKTKNTSAIPTLENLAKMAHTTAPPWKAGNNTIDQMAMPFPPTLEGDFLTSIIHDLVRDFFQYDGLILTLPYYRTVFIQTEMCNL